MNWLFIFNQISLFIATVVSIALAIYAWRQRNAPGAKAFSWLMISAAWLSSAYFFMQMSRTMETAFFFFKLVFVALGVIPVAWFIFSMRHAHSQREFTRRQLALLLIVPLLTQVVIWTNGLHGGFFNTSLLHEGVMNPGELGLALYGPWFWVHTVYSYCLIMIAVILVVQTAIRAFSVYQGQAIALLIGAFVPLGGNMLDTFAPTLVPGVNWTPLGFAIGGVAWGWATFRYRLFDVIPVARDVLIDNMRDGMLVLDAQARVVDINPALSAILGIPVNQAIGQPAIEVLAPWRDLIDRLRDAGDTQFEFSLERNGVRYYYDLRMSMLRDRRGKLTGRLIVLHDITTRKQAEEAMRQYTIELEASNAELDAFAHTVAHDLKGPLSTLIALSTSLQIQYDDMSAKKIIARLDRVTQNAYRMSNIIDELLLLASVRKLEEVDTQMLDMSSIVHEAMDRLLDMINKSKADIIVPDGWPRAWGYGPWVEEVWVNYISNALKYGGKPEARIPPRVVLGYDEPVEDSTVRFWVRDNGPGLDGEEQSRLFAQFTRLHEVRAEGHGLGLSIVQRIIEKLGGVVGVESMPGKGSTFYFTLPREAAVSSDRPAEKGPADEGTER